MKHAKNSTTRGPTPTGAQRVELTFVEKLDGPRLSKSYSRGESGKPVGDDSQCSISAGWMRRVYISGVEDMPALIDSLRPNEAPILGKMAPSLGARAPFVKKKWLKEVAPSVRGIVTRTKETLGHRDGEPGLMYFDHDRKGAAPAVIARMEELGGFEAALATLDPQLAHTGYAVRESTSSGMFNAETGEEFPGSGGLHVYAIIKNSADLKTYLEALVERGWLHGLSYYMIGSVGQLLERSIIDASVGSPERLVFEAPPRLEPPLQQHKREMIVRPGGMIDARKLPALTADEKTEIERRKREARAALGKPLKEARKKAVAARVEAIVKKNPEIAPAEAKRAAERLFGGVLEPSVILHFADPALGETTVADVLRDPDRYIEEPLADPLEGPDYGSTTAMLFRRDDGSLWIFSYAHGRTDYRIESDDVAARLAKIVANATPIEVDFMSFEEGQAQLAAAVQSTINDFLQWAPQQGEPPTIGQRATVAIGKSEIALRAIFGALFLIRRRRGKRGRRVIVLAVPTHALSAELETRFNNIVREKVETMQERARAAGDMPHVVACIGRWSKLSVATWRGREALAPDGFGERMCLDLPGVREAQKLQRDIEGKVCKRCEHRDRCAYRAQYKKHADLWIVAHQTLFGGMPRPFPAAGVEFVIIDESPDKAGLRGVGDNDQVIVKVSELAPGSTPLPEKMSRGNAEYLQNLRSSLKHALNRAAYGWLKASTLKQAGITERDAAWAAQAEWRRVYRGDDLFRIEANRSAEPMARMWQEIAELLRENGPEYSGRLSVFSDMKTTGRELHVAGYSKIHPDFRKPTLLIDAMFDAARARPMFPNIVELDAINVDAPFARILKSVGRSSAKSMLVPMKPHEAELRNMTPEDFEAENLRRANNRAALRVNLINLARRHDGKTLVVGYKELIELLDLPRSIATANFNAVAGRDVWKDYDLLVIVGRPLPPPYTVEKIAGAVRGERPAEVRRWYEQQPTPTIVRLPQGAGFGAIAVEADRHPDAIGELHRARICEGELLQAIGRLRPIRRTADRQATVVLLNDTQLPGLPIDAFFDANAFYEASPEDVMFAMGGVALESPTDAFKAYPGLWPSVEAAKKALQRSGTRGQTPYSDPNSQASYILNREMSPCSIRYKLAGPKQHFKSCTAVRSVVLNPKEELERLLGPLAYFELDAREPPILPFADLPFPIELALERARIARRWLERPENDLRAA